MPGINTLSLAHRFIREHVPAGGLCIDATAGRGYDTALLCELVGETGRVIAFDIQQEALDSTRQLLESRNLHSIAELHLDSHHHMAQYADAGTVDCITFNFGYLPRGDHSICTHPETSISAIEQGLTLLKPGGIMSLCIYYGGDTGFEEKDALLQYLKTIDSKVYTVLTTEFYNRPNNPPIPVQILKEV
ncbi:MAG: class I SAM-dependent methyltransferase [Candidatus Merdivicinus sp.]